MQRMIQTLTEKGEQNRLLSETVNSIKNQLLIEQIFDCKFSVQLISAFQKVDYTFKFVRDRSEAGEFFLEIATTPTQQAAENVGPGRVRKRICIIDIEEIEPVQGTKFELRYHCRPTLKDQFSWKKDKTLRVETYTSKNIAEILDGFRQVSEMYEAQERELDRFLENTEALKLEQLNEENE